MPPGATPPPRQGGGQNTAMAIVAYILFFVPLLTDAKNDPFVKYHVKQGLVLFLGFVVVQVLNMVLPFLFWYYLNWILELGLLVLMIMGIMKAANGKQEPLPVLGQFAEMFKF